MILDSYITERKNDPSFTYFEQKLNMQLKNKNDTFLF